MKPAPFAYLLPGCAEEALEMLARHGEDARVLAGGQSLVPLMNLRLARPKVIVDLNNCSDLFGHRRENGFIAIGAMTRQATVERDDGMQRDIPLLAAALPYVGFPANRTRGTMGGSFAHADPAAELPGVAIALDASFVIDGSSGPRTVSAKDFFRGQLATAIGAGELLREIRIPVAPPATRSCFIEAGNRSHDLAIAGLAAQAIVDEDGRYRDLRLAAFGVGDRPVRLAGAEAVAMGRTLDRALIARCAAAAAAAIDPPTDAVASAGYRRTLIEALTAQALTAIAEGAGRRHDA